MRSFKIILAYDGADFVGWQRQAAGVSIQGLLEDALRVLDGRDVAVAGAGRTDAGVHALGQVASFTLTREMAADTLARALNAHLPPAVRVVNAEAVPASFHARFAAHAKTYRYQLWTGEVMDPFERGRAWHMPGSLDVAAMRAAAQRLEGRHDFAAFQAAGSDVTTTEREIFTSRIADGGLRIGQESANQSALHSAFRNPKPALLCYEVTGSGFLRHMVRTIVGSLVDVGRGRHPVEWIDAVLASRDRTRAGQTAPAHGLFLVSVDYATALAAGS